MPTDIMRKRHLPSIDLESVTMCGHRTTEQEFLIDYRGDREKILLAIDAGLKFLKKEKKIFLEENNF